MFSILEMIKLFFYIFMGAHFISTIFVGIAYHEGIENSWIEKYNLPGNWFDHYMYALVL